MKTAGALYFSPFLTCQRCNTLNVVNPTHIKDTAHFIHAKVGFSIPVASLSPCIQCHALIDFCSGVSRFPLEDQTQTSDRLTFESLNRAAGTLQRLYRGYLGRQAAHAQRATLMAKERHQHQAASVIQARQRGIIGRRTTKVQSALRIIEDSPEVVRAFVLSNTGESKPVFWFEFQDPDELECLYGDYRTYVDRLGQSTELRGIEENVMLIATRVLKCIDRACAKIQLAFRHYQSRKFWALLHQRKALLMTQHTSAVMILQRLFRGLRARGVQVRQMRHMRNSRECLKIYLASRSAQRQQEHIQERHAVLQKFYQGALKVAPTVTKLTELPLEHLAIVSSGPRETKKTRRDGILVAYNQSPQKHRKSLRRRNPLLVPVRGVLPKGITGLPRINLKQA